MEQRIKEQEQEREVLEHRLIDAEQQLKNSAKVREELCQKVSHLKMKLCIDVMREDEVCDAFYLVAFIAKQRFTDIMFHLYRLKQWQEKTKFYKLLRRSTNS